MSTAVMKHRGKKHGEEKDYMICMLQSILPRKLRQKPKGGTETEPGGNVFNGLFSVACSAAFII